MVKVPTGARYMDDVWISGHLARRGVGRVAVPMDKVEPRARWTGGGGGPDLSRVNNMGRKAMNDEALQAFRGHWDVLRCARGELGGGAAGGAAGALVAPGSLAAATPKAVACNPGDVVALAEGGPFKRRPVGVAS